MLARKICGALIASALAGCATVPSGPLHVTAKQPLKCVNDQSVVDVDIDVTDSKVEFPPLINLNGCGRKVKIHWQLVSGDAPATGWQFELDGIRIKDNDGNFHDGAPGDDRSEGKIGRHYFLVDENSGGKKYKYTFVVRKHDHSAYYEVDPNIENRP